MLNTKMKRIWFAWLAAFIVTIIAIAIVGSFINKKLASDIMFGIAAVGLLPMVYNFVVHKGGIAREYGRKGIKVEPESTMVDYLGSSKGNDKNLSRQVKDMRRFYIYSFSGIICTLGIILAIIFAYV